MGLICVQTLTHALLGVLMVGGSLGRSLSQGSDVTGLDKTSPESSAMKYYITGTRDEEGHWTEQVKIEHGGEDWHVDVDHATLEKELGHPKVKITASFSAAKPRTPSVKGGVAVMEEVEAKKDKRWVYKLYPKSHLDWFGAEVKCEEWGGHLAIPDTREELSELTRILQEHNKETGEITNAFLGFTDLGEVGSFVTVLGKPLFRSQDATWSPSWYRSDDKSSIIIDGDYCGTLRSSGELNAVHCRSRMPFICERARDKEEVVDSLQLFPMTGKNWFEARKACVEWGGHLAIPDSEEKMNKMTLMLKSPEKNPDQSGAFLGFNDIKKEGEFVTIFGKPVFNSNGQRSPHWYKSIEPDDNKGWTTEGEDCGSMRSNGGLNDVPCRYHLPYFCEKSSEIDNPRTTEEGYEHPGENGQTHHIIDGLYGEDKVDKYDDSTLRLFTRSDLDWSEANDACKVWGGYLASPPESSLEKFQAMTLKMQHAEVDTVFVGGGNQDLKGHLATIPGASEFFCITWSLSEPKGNQPDAHPGKKRLPYFCEKPMPLEEPSDEDDALTIDTTSPATPDDDSDVLLDRGYVFQLFPASERNWLEAEVACKEWGGHLAIPDTLEKLSELKKILREHIEETGVTTDAFLGFTDFKQHGNFVTVTARGKRLNIAWFLIVYHGEADHDESKSKDGRDCGLLRSRGNLGSVHCSSRNRTPFICERARGMEQAVDEEETTSPAETSDEVEDSLRLFPDSAVNWFAAKEACIEWGGHLAIPDSEEKMNKMTQMLNSPEKNPDLSGAFLGFNDIKKEGEFVTIFGKPVFNSNGQWSPHWFESAQPDDDKGWTTEGEDCGSLRPNGGLNDVPCRYHLPYFCEKSSEIDNLQETEEGHGHPGETAHTRHPFEEGSSGVNEDEDDDEDKNGGNDDDAGSGQGEVVEHGVVKN